MTVAAYPSVFESYEQRREQLAAWTERHYIAEFGLAPCRLLDAGCGEGFWAGIFSAAGFDAHGFDIESAYVEAGRVKYPRVSLTVADALEPLPYEPASFGVVFVRTMSCFYAYRLTRMRKALENLLTHVASGGLMLVSVYSDGSGEPRPGVFGGTFRHHPHDAYLTLAAGVGTVTHTATKGNYLQIGLRP